MNRRELVTNLGLAMAFGWAYKPEAPKRWGAMTVERHTALSARGIHLHVFHNGQDITKGCHFADDTGDGVAELFLRDDNGRLYVDSETGSVAKKTVYGVTMLEGEPLI